MQLRQNYSKLRQRHSIKCYDNSTTNETNKNRCRSLQCRHNKRQSTLSSEFHAINVKHIQSQTNGNRSTEFLYFVARTRLLRRTESARHSHGSLITDLVILGWSQGYGYAQPIRIGINCIFGYGGLEPLRTQHTMGGRSRDYATLCRRGIGLCSPSVLNEFVFSLSTQAVMQK